MSGLDELQHELVLGLRRVGRVLVARIVGVAQEVALGRELEAGRLDFLAQEGLLDAVQGARFGDAGAGPAGMVGDAL